MYYYSNNTLRGLGMLRLVISLDGVQGEGGGGGGEFVKGQIL